MKTVGAPARLYLFDWIVLVYCGLMVALLFLIGEPLGEHSDEVVSYVALGMIALAIASFVDETKSRGHAFVRLLYPVFMFTFFYRLTGGTVFLLFDRFFDPELTAFERSIFGTNLTLYIDRHLLNVVVTEIVSFCYFCYYLMIPGFVLFAFIRKKDDTLRRFNAAATLVFFVGYLMFFLYPIEGPRWHFAGAYINDVSGPFFRAAVDFVIAMAAVRGGCMPSTHTAVAMIVWYYSYRVWPQTRWWLGLIVFGLTVGTVWGRFHYTSDTIVGALMAIGAIWLIERLYRERLVSRKVQGMQMKESTSHAS